MLLKTAVTVLVLLALAYAGLCGLMYARQRDLMYFPQVTRPVADQPDFAFRNGDTELKGWVVNPGKPRAILYFGGNAERVEGMRASFARWFPDATTYLVPYRGYGPNAGAPQERLLFGDALALYDHVEKSTPQSVAVVGRSLGSGVASHVASRRPVSRLVLITPFDSLAEVGQAHYRWIPVRWLTRDKYESARVLRNYRQPVLIIRAGRDEVIPSANTDRLIAALPTPPRVLELPEAGHNDVQESPLFAQALTEHLR